MTQTDRIEKKVVLHAPRTRVWRAIAVPEEFGAWFGMRLEGQFVPGSRVRGRLTIPGYEHLALELVVERVEPERLFSYRWHPYAVDPAVDYSGEPMTLVEFTLEDEGTATRLTVVESGFDRIPAVRRETALRMNDGGWAQQLKNVARYLQEGPAVTGPAERR